MLVVLLVRRQHASGRAWGESIRGFLSSVKRPMWALVFVGALVIGADFLLPLECIETSVIQHRPADDGGVEVFYLVCCSGGDVASCKTSPAPELVPGRSILVQRSRLLDRCSVEPSTHPSQACKCPT
jgi:hypothetical protein